MRRFLWAIPVAFFFLNPSFACSGPDEPQFQYDATEMRAAVEGHWIFTLMPTGASAPISLTVKVEQAAAAPAPQARAAGRSLVRAAHACGSRTLVKSAQACIDVSQMPLTVTFVDGDPSFATADLSGVFSVYGTQFTSANTHLDLNLGDYVIHAQVGLDREVFNAVVGPGPSGAPAGSLTIVTHP